MIDPNKRLIDCSLQELGEFIDLRIKANQKEEYITTAQLCQKREFTSGVLTYYKKLGLKQPGYNRWLLSEFDNWYVNVYSKMISPGRRKVKIT